MNTPGPSTAYSIKKEPLMRAAVLTKPGQFEIHRVPLPQPGPGQVRVRIESCGVCASNLAPWEGKPWFNYPMDPGTLGHEGCGHIESIGSGVTSLQIGQRVATLSVNAYSEFDVTDCHNGHR